MDDKSDNDSMKPLDKDTLVAVLQFLKKNNLQGSEEVLRRETGFQQPLDHRTSSTLLPANNNATAADSDLALYETEEDPQLYFDNYAALKRLIDKTLDMYKYELGQLLYPVFMHMYLCLVYNCHTSAADTFLRRHRVDHEPFLQADIERLSHVRRPDHMADNELVQHFRSSHYTVRMCRDTYVLLKRHMQERHNATLLSLVQDHVLLDISDGVPRGAAIIRQTAGALEGDPSRQVNKMKMLYGLLKEPDIQLNVPAEEDDEDEDNTRPKKKKGKRDSLLSKKSKHDPNAPTNNRIPLPELRDADRRERAKQLRETMKRASIGPDHPPSICFYTLLNATDNVSAVSINEDSSLLAVGLETSVVRVWSLLPHKLRTMKSADQLADINKDADDVLVRMMDDRTAEQSRTLAGHSGPVYSVCISADKSLLLSASEDGTIRLWSLHTWTCVVCYRGHVFPVWHASFAPLSHYFCSGGHDRTVRLWATDHHQPLRVMTGHYSDVVCVTFHPNCNYIASGSCDRSARVWDVSNGACVRILTGHKDTVQQLCFSPDGRFLVTAGGGGDLALICWDMATGFMVAALCAHSQPVLALQFSRDAAVLVSGGLDDCIKVWDFVKITEDVLSEEVASLQSCEVRDLADVALLHSYRTKHTAVLALHFSRRNLLLASGPYHG